MASQPHDKTGRSCGICETPFNKHSYVGTVSRLATVVFEFEGKALSRKFHVPVLHCRTCHSKHYSESE